MFGAFGCESTLQFSCIAQTEPMKLPYEWMDTSEEHMKKTNYQSTMNDAIDKVLDKVYSEFPEGRIELYEPAYMRAQMSKRFLKAYF